MINFKVTWLASVQFSSIQFSCSVMSDSLWPQELQHARPPCPSPTPGVHSSSCPLSRWCHPAISSSVVPFSSCPQSLPASCTINGPLRYKVHKHAQIADKTLFLGISVRVFLEGIHIWISRLSKEPSYQWEWVWSTPFKAWIEQRGRKRAKLVSLFEPEHLSSPALQHQYHWVLCLRIGS